MTEIQRQAPMAEPAPASNVQLLRTGTLVQEYRDVVTTIGRAHERGEIPEPRLTRRADFLEEEILRRMAW